MTKTPQMLEMERESGRDIRDLLREAYAAERTVSRAAAKLGISHGAFWTWMDLLGGRIRSKVEFPGYDPEPAEEVAAA